MNEQSTHLETFGVPETTLGGALFSVILGRLGSEVLTSTKRYNQRSTRPLRSSCRRTGRIVLTYGIQRVWLVSLYFLIVFYLADYVSLYFKDLGHDRE